MEAPTNYPKRESSAALFGTAAKKTKTKTPMTRPDEQHIEAEYVYWGGFRYDPTQVNETISRFKNGLSFPIGISHKTLGVIFLENHPERQTEALVGGSRYNGLGSGILTFDATTDQQELPVNNFPPALLGLPVAKRFLGNMSPLLENSVTDDEIEHIIMSMMVGANVTYWAPIFDVSDLPFEGMDILLQFQRNNPEHLMAPVMLVQKTLQWIYINNQKNHGLEPVIDDGECSEQHERHLVPPAALEDISLYFSSLPLWTSFVSETHERETITTGIPLTRRLRVPATWSGKTVVDREAWEKFSAQQQSHIFWENTKSSAHRLDAGEGLDWIAVSEGIKADYVYYIITVYPLILAVEILNYRIFEGCLEEGWLAGDVGTGKMTRLELQISMKLCSGVSAFGTSVEVESLLSHVELSPNAGREDLKAFARKWLGVPECVRLTLEGMWEWEYDEWMNQLDRELEERFGAYDEMKMGALRESKRFTFIL
ncbi:hypothetical protein QBC43DRAFT_297429 [Cladorrhinum sp. PSN259]|nr:hypothetical protein QBC43DRAFT_297429 [Cladorrhinum sp. PSN259]